MKKYTATIINVHGLIPPVTLQCDEALLCDNGTILNTIDSSNCEKKLIAFAPKDDRVTLIENIETEKK